MIKQGKPFPRLSVLQVHKQLVVLRLSVGQVIDVRRAAALGQRVVARVGEIVAVGKNISLRERLCDGVIRVGPHGGCVRDCRHRGFFAFLFLTVNDEEEEEDEHEEYQDDDSCNGSDLIRVHGHSGTRQTVEIPYNDHASLVTARALPAGITVAGASHVITAGVIEAVTHLPAAVSIRSCGTLLLTVASHEACAAGAVTGDVIAVCAVLTLTHQHAVLPVEAQRTALCAVEPRPAGRTLALAVVSAAERPVVAVTGVDAVRTPLTRRTRL